MDVELEMDFHENGNELYINLVGPDIENPYQVKRTDFRFFTVPLFLSFK